MIDINTYKMKVKRFKTYVKFLGIVCISTLEINRVSHISQQAYISQWCADSIDTSNLSNAEIEEYLKEMGAKRVDQNNFGCFDLTSLEGQEDATEIFSDNCRIPLVQAVIVYDEKEIVPKNLEDGKEEDNYKTETKEIAIEDMHRYQEKYQNKPNVKDVSFQYTYPTEQYLKNRTNILMRAIRHERDFVVVFSALQVIHNYDLTEEEIYDTIIGLKPSMKIDAIQYDAIFSLFDRSPGLLFTHEYMFSNTEDINFYLKYKVLSDEIKKTTDSEEKEQLAKVFYKRVKSDYNFSFIPGLKTEPEDVTPSQYAVMPILAEMEIESLSIDNINVGLNSSKRKKLETYNPVNMIRKHSLTLKKCSKYQGELSIENLNKGPTL